MNARRRWLPCFLLPLLAASLGCRQKMDTDPKYEPMEPSNFFADGLSARPVVEGTVARSQLDADSAYFKGKSRGAYLQTFPAPVTREMLERGQQRFNIFCSPCHGRLGDGQGMIVKRGLHGPVNFHEAKYVNSPPGYFFDVMTNGRGAMYPYGYRIPVSDRWAIIAYIRALQLSENARVSDVPPSKLSRLEGGSK